MAPLPRPEPSSTNWAARVGRGTRERWWLARHRVPPARLAFRAGAVTVAISVALTAGGWVHDSRRAAAGWGQRVAVVVSDHDLLPGHVIAQGEVRSEPWPRRLVGDDALHDADDAVGRVVTQPIVAGEAVVGSRLGEGRLGLGPGEEAITLVPPLAFPPVTAGDRVELFTVTGATPQAGDPGGTDARRVTAGRVVAVNDDGVGQSVTVAVPRDVTADLVEAQAVGVVEIVIAP